VRPGNSGGPVVDGSGRVVATVFAATEGEAHKGGLAIPGHVVAGVLAGAGGVSPPDPALRDDRSRALPCPTDMPKTLVIAEKPSVGKDLAKILPGPWQKQHRFR